MDTHVGATDYGIAQVDAAAERGGGGEGVIFVAGDGILDLLSTKVPYHVEPILRKHAIYSARWWPP